MMYGSVRWAEPLTLPDVPNMLLESLSVALIKEVIWPKLSDVARHAMARMGFWLLFQYVKHSKSARHAFLEFFEELRVVNREAAVEMNLPGYPT